MLGSVNNLHLALFLGYLILSFNWYRPWKIQRLILSLAHSHYRNTKSNKHQGKMENRLIINI
jgi:hypothetical protein